MAVTERLEPTGFGRSQPVEATGPDGRRRLLRRPQLARPNRRTALIGLGLLAGGGTAAIAYALAGSAAGWLHVQPEYQLPFDEIALDPEPPAYIKPGRLGLLRRVRRRANLPETLAVPALDLAELAGAFRKHSPWVLDVEQIDRSYPNRLVVKLKYREPVGLISPRGSAQILLDRHAIVLPADELDPAAAGPMLQLYGLDGPFDPKAGIGLAAPDSPEEERAVAAAALAGFLRDRLLATGPLPNNRRIVAVNVRAGASKLYLWTDSGLWILWGPMPGDEPPGTPTAAEKWDQLRDWLVRNPNHSSQVQASVLFFQPDGAQLGRRAG